MKMRFFLEIRCLPYSHTHEQDHHLTDSNEGRNSAEIYGEIVIICLIILVFSFWLMLQYAQNTLNNVKLHHHHHRRTMSNVESSREERYLGGQYRNHQRMRAGQRVCMTERKMSHTCNMKCLIRTMSKHTHAMQTSAFCARDSVNVRSVSSDTEWHNVYTLYVCSHEINFNYLTQRSRANLKVPSVLVENVTLEEGRK